MTLQTEPQEPAYARASTKQELSDEKIAVSIVVLAVIGVGFCIGATLMLLGAWTPQDGVDPTNLAAAGATLLAAIIVVAVTRATTQNWREQRKAESEKTLRVHRSRVYEELVASAVRTLAAASPLRHRQGTGQPGALGLRSSPERVCGMAESEHAGRERRERRTRYVREGRALATPGSV